MQWLHGSWCVTEKLLLESLVPGTVAARPRLPCKTSSWVHFALLALPRPNKWLLPSRPKLSTSQENRGTTNKQEKRRAAFQQFMSCKNWTDNHKIGTRQSAQVHDICCACTRDIRKVCSLPPVGTFVSFVPETFWSELEMWGCQCNPEFFKLKLQIPGCTSSELSFAFIARSSDFQKLTNVFFKSYPQNERWTVPELLVFIFLDVSRTLQALDLSYIDRKIGTRKVMSEPHLSHTCCASDKQTPSYSNLYSSVLFLWQMANVLVSSRRQTGFLRADPMIQFVARGHQAKGNKLDTWIQGQKSSLSPSWRNQDICFILFFWIFSCSVIGCFLCFYGLTKEFVAEWNCLLMSKIFWYHFWWHFCQHCILVLCSATNLTTRRQTQLLSSWGPIREEETFPKRINLVGLLLDWSSSQWLSIGEDCQQIHTEYEIFYM